MQSFSDKALWWQFSYQALLKLGHYWMYLAYAELHLLTCLLCSALLLYKEVEAGKKGETGCVHQRPSKVFSSLTPDTHTSHGCACSCGQQFCCLSSCHWISLQNSLFRETEVILTASRAAVDVEGMKDRAVSQAYSGKAPPLITFHYNWRARAAESSGVMWELKGQAGTLYTALVRL